MRILLLLLVVLLSACAAAPPVTQVASAPVIQAPRSPVKPAEPAPAPVINVLSAARLHYPIDFSPALQASIDDWLTWKREDFFEAIENFAYLKAKIAPIYAEAGLPEALLFGMAAKESLGRAHSYSPVGAVGLLQFMPATAMRYGLRMQDRMDLRLDAEAATRANARYIHDQLALLDGDLSLVLAAYNSGEGRLARLHKRFPNASFFDPEIQNALPLETRDFVPMVLAASWLYLNPQIFGLPQFSSTHAALELKRESSLGELTICLADAGGNEDGWFRTLRNLNPRLKPGDRLQAGQRIEVPEILLAAYAERCVDTALAQHAARLHAANYPPLGATVAYTVRPGDTLAMIARRSGCTSIEALGALNELKAPDYLLSLGQVLKLPRCAG